jgi:hypothetical protein
MLTEKVVKAAFFVFNLNKHCLHKRYVDIVTVHHSHVQTRGYWQEIARQTDHNPCNYSWETAHNEDYTGHSWLSDAVQCRF